MESFGIETINITLPKFSNKLFSGDLIKINMFWGQNEASPCRK